MRFNQQSTFFIPLQPPPTSCTCKCNSRNTVTHRISACSSRWATIIISTLVLVTFVIVAGVVFVVLNETQGKSNSQGKFFHRNASITNCLWFDWFSFCFFCFFSERRPITFRSTLSTTLSPNTSITTDGISSDLFSSTVSSLWTLKILHVMCFANNMCYLTCRRVGFKYDYLHFRMV